MYMLGIYMYNRLHLNYYSLARFDLQLGLAPLGRGGSRSCRRREITRLLGNPPPLIPECWVFFYTLYSQNSSAFSQMKVIKMLKVGRSAAVTVAISFILPLYPHLPVGKQAASYWTYRQLKQSLKNLTQVMLTLTCQFSLHDGRMGWYWTRIILAGNRDPILRRSQTGYRGCRCTPPTGREVRIPNKFAQFVEAAVPRIMHQNHQNYTISRRKIWSPSSYPLILHSL